MSLNTEVAVEKSVNGVQKVKIKTKHGISLLEKCLVVAAVLFYFPKVSQYDFAPLSYRLPFLRSFLVVTICLDSDVGKRCVI